MISQRLYRATATVAGLLLVAVAVFADVLGFGQPGSFGSGQIILALLGGMLALFGTVGADRFVELYRNAALIAVNTVLIFVVLELTCIVAARLGVVPSPSLLADYPLQPYYRSQSWSTGYWREAAAAERYRYASYSLWRHLPFEGEFVNVDHRGIRKTPASDCSANSYRVVVLGGSAAWGFGSPDWGTVPAYLQPLIASTTGRPVCIKNLGEDGYVTNQSLIALVRHIQDDFLPDLVVSYEGVNDVTAALQSGRAGSHISRSRIAELFERKRHPLVTWLSDTRLYGMLGTIIGLTDQPKVTESAPADSGLVDDVIRVYANNVATLRGTGAEFGFKLALVWQPHIITGLKTLTPEEEGIQQRLDVNWEDLYRKATRRVCEDLVLESPELVCANSVFEDYSDQIWIDEWGHVTPSGNEIVAQFIISHIRRIIEPTGASASELPAM